MDILDRVRRTIRQHQLAGPQTRVLVALSGGSDSVALSHLLMVLDAAGELTVAGFAHFNHQLRATALRDEQFCEAVSAACGRPLLVDSADVAALARRTRHSIEDAARAARHDFLDRARTQLSADVVALGHTRDDQAETFLLRLLRGAGVRGLAAMHPRRGAVIRPLLDCRRAELRDYLSARAIGYVHDETNDDVSVPRNRVRAELLPLLERRFNPAIVDVLADEASLARDEWRWMEDASAELFGTLCRCGGDVCRIEAASLNALPAALARFVVRRALTELAGGRVVTFAHVEAALRLSREDGPPVDLPGQRVERIAGDVVLRGRPSGIAGRRASGTRPVNLFRYSLSIPGEVWIAESGGVVSAEVAPAALSPGAVTGNGVRSDVAYVQVGLPRGPFGVRNRRPGDRFRPFGLNGGKKLQDFFVDRKVARAERDAVPLVVDESDRIIWVAGHGIDDRFRVTNPAQAVVVLRLKQQARN